MRNPFFCYEDNYDTSKPLIIYGFGQNCLHCLRGILGENIKVLAIFDKNPLYHNTSVYNIPVLPVEKISEFDRDCNVFISTVQEKWSLSQMFLHLGFKHLYYINRHEYNRILRANASRETYEKMAAAHATEIAAARSLIQDDISRQIFDARLQGYTTSEWGPLEQFYTKEDYYPTDLFRFTNEEVLADCGAFDGASSFAFRDRMMGNYSHIYAFEPNELHCLITSRNFEYYGLARAEAHRYAICDYEGTISFQNDWADHCGHISNLSDTLVPCTSLDLFFAKPGRKVPTFIKMDIEGAEVAGLIGAKELINNYKPKLAICMYHRFEDIWELPILINELSDGGYALHLRHSACFWDTVCFAVPK